MQIHYCQKLESLELEKVEAIIDLTKDEDYMLYSGAMQEAVTSFIESMGPGPDPLTLQSDIMATHKLDWNQWVIDILLSLSIYLWRRRTTGPQESTCKATIKLLMVKMPTRSLKLGKRSLLSDQKVTGKDNLSVWVYLNSIMETLGKDGMSSDKSDIDDCEVPALRLKSLAIFTPRGSKPAKHIHNPKWESLQPAVAALPKAFYNPLWLMGAAIQAELKYYSTYASP
ncbi:uncharacterized protein BJ212DRAFT_1306355 [Suillus subaureus]|uniref:Uncharacterized protein n=1 Tax=Suillus subaureus TaxID=48587 RepID=A0A9P7AUZ6_9AGAM|nr:uncharacterized protein BJ212DRAFT_1306355 [Suillus subaureus]KAG1796170.1 hypothetical protein BJ212DRAFT_1306355 [Suillus subaureus]